MVRLHLVRLRRLALLPFMCLLLSIAAPVSAQPRFRLIDPDGRETTHLVRGHRYQIELEAAARNEYPEYAESVEIGLWSEGSLSYSSGFKETGLSTGIFRGDMMAVWDPQQCRPAILCLPLAGSEFQARHLLPDGSVVESVFGLSFQALDLIDREGRPVAEALEGAPLRVRLIDSLQQISQLEWRTVLAASQLGGDAETVVIWETKAESGVFEGQLPTRFLAGQSGGTGNDGELSLGHDPSAGSATGESVLLHYPAGYLHPPIDLAIPTAVARLTVRDGALPATQAAGGSLTAILDFPFMAASGPLALLEVQSTLAGDHEMFRAAAGPDGVYRQQVPFAFAPALSGDRVVSVVPGGEAVFLYQLSAYRTTGDLEVTLPVAGALLRFVDPATGEPLATAPDLRPFKLQLREFQNSASAVELRHLTLGSSLAGDHEQVQLVETGADTGVFEAVVQPRFRPEWQEPQPGFEVGRHTSGLYDVAIAQVLTAWGEIATASLPLTGTRLEWTDAEGTPVGSIAIGGTAYLQIDDPALGTDPAQADTQVVQIAQTGSIRDEEFLTLVETGQHTGIFRGSLPVATGPHTPRNGLLEPLDGGPYVTFGFYRPYYAGYGLNLVKEALVKYSDLVLLDSAGQKATTFLEGETLRLRAVDVDAGLSPAIADQVYVWVTSVSGHDQENVELVETGIDSGIFEGSLPTRLAPAQNGNGQLELSRGAGSDTALAIYRDSSARATFETGRLRLIDRLGREIFQIGKDWQMLGVELVLTGLDPLVVDFLSGAVVVEYHGDASTFEAESLTLEETGPATGVFRGFLQIGWEPYPGSHTGILGVDPNSGGLVVARWAAGGLLASLRVIDDQAPVVYGEDLQLASGASAVLAVLDNDYDPEGTALLLGAAFGTIAASVNPDGTLTITASPDAVGPCRVSYLVSDAAGSISEGHINVFVVPEPVLTLLGPAGGTVFPKQGQIQFTATATDPQDGDLGSQIVWSSDRQGNFGGGSPFAVPGAYIETGTHLITASVTNSHGRTASASVTIVVDAAPTIEIVEPHPHALVLQEGPNTFAAAVADLEQSGLAAQIEWSSPTLGQVGTGAAIVLDLEPTSHLEIRAGVRDSAGNEVTQIRQFMVNGRPTVTIISPADGALLDPAQPVSLGASANDTEDGDLTEQIGWVSSLDGQLGQGSPLALSAGVHQITASVADSHGAVGSREMTITVVDLNTAPRVLVLSPANGTKVATADAVAFSAAATDDQSGDVSASLVWTSSLVSGSIGAGPSFSLATLPVGNHSITATATDPQGLQGTATFDLVVANVATLTFVSAGPQDGFVLESGEDTGVGGLASSGQPRLGDNLADRQYRSFFSFDTAALPDGAVVRKATFRAYRSGTTGTNPATTHGNLSADVKSGFFGSSATLENSDFQDPATVAGTCLITPAAANGQWSTGVFDTAGRAAVNLTGLTQVRLQLALDDDDDATNDYLDHYGGESTVASTRPQLVIEYLP